MLFVYIGWSDKYDGKEAVWGSHGWVAKNPRNCSEMSAFVKEGGEYCCGIGSGSVPSTNLDIVLVAKPPGSPIRRVVGLYVDVRVEPWQGADNGWRGAIARRAIRFPPHARFAVSDWPGTSGVRRWARRAGAPDHRALLAYYRRASATARDIRAGVAARAEEDEELAAVEGRLRKRFVTHRRRERRLRDAKVQIALSQNDGRLRCEVRGCGFDFLQVYGPLGAGYAQVHHNRPLSASPARGERRALADLAIVCANCHAMIHRGGECRSLDAIRVHRKRRR